MTPRPPRCSQPGSCRPMKRRRLGLAAAALPLLGIVHASKAQSARARRVGLLAPSTRKQEQVNLAPFFAEMRKLGWHEGDNIEYDWALGDDHDERRPRRAAELVAKQPELIYAPPSIAAIAAKNATQTIPIIFAVAT